MPNSEGEPETDGDWVPVREVEIDRVGVDDAVSDFDCVVVFVVVDEAVAVLDEVVVRETEGEPVPVRETVDVLVFAGLSEVVEDDELLEEEVSLGDCELDTDALELTDAEGDCAAVSVWVGESEKVEVEDKDGVSVRTSVLVGE